MTIAELRLLAWLSPAFPTGGYTCSHGLEWAVEAGDIVDAETLFAWLDDILRHGAGGTDTILLRHAHRARGDLAVLAPLVELALATASGRERRAEAVGQGNAFMAAARAWPFSVLSDLAERVGDLPYSVALGALAGVAGIAEDRIAAGALQALAANLISAAVRLVPLGQSAGLAVLARLEETVVAVGRQTRDATLDDIGGCCFRADLAAMLHETQYTRLFRT